MVYESATSYDDSSVVKDMAEKLVGSLLAAASVGAGIARSCKVQGPLAELLVQAKGEGEANPRFACGADFKTLADVLIQQVLRKRLAREFPELADHIHGEENDSFTNSSGRTITIRIEDDPKATEKLLSEILDGHVEAAGLLAAAAHADAVVDIDSETSECLRGNVPVENLGIWIDPIDSTLEYIQGKCGSDNAENICLSGLSCVTVLIGVFDRTDGRPVMGVIDQPFFHKLESRRLWGINYGDVKFFSHPVGDSAAARKIVCISSSEDAIVKSKLKDAGYELAEPAGAGYKLLMVILGHADAYVLSKSSTYKWDTCAPHAILRSLDGGIVNYESVLSADKNDLNFSDHGLKYSSDHCCESDETKIGRWCNRGGIIAYRNESTLSELVQILSN